MVQKNPEMDPHFATDGIPQLKLLCTQISLAERSGAEDVRFIKRSLLEENCPDFHGLITNEVRNAGQAPNPKLSITFRQFIDQVPSESSTMVPSMVYAEKVTNAAGQKNNCVYCRSAVLQCCSWYHVG